MGTTGKMTHSKLVCSVALMALLAVASAKERLAIARLQTAAGYRVFGYLMLQQVDCSAAVSITGNITGLTEGFHGFHVHELGDVSDSCKLCGPHFNLKGEEHGGPTTPARHTGDLGNVVADASGFAIVNIADKSISLCPTTNCVLGRSLVVHLLRDDLGKGPVDSLTKVTGNVGPRIACGTIALVLEPPPPCPSCRYT